MAPAPGLRTPRYIRPRDVAQRFRVSLDAVYRWIHNGKLPDHCIVRLGGSYRIDESAFLDELRAGNLFARKPRTPAAALP